MRYLLVIKIYIILLAISTNRIIEKVSNFARFLLNHMRYLRAWNYYLISYRITVSGKYKWVRVPWTARRSNQSILREIDPENSLKGLLLKLKLQYFGHLMWKADSLEKSLMLGKIEGRRRSGCQRMRWLHGIISAMDMKMGKLWEMVREREAWCAAVHGVSKSWTWLDNWTKQ